MRTRQQTVYQKLASLPCTLWRLRHDKQFRRYIAFSLAANAVGYSLVYLLTSRGVAGNWWANESVSKGMAPMGLVLNTLALTGKLKPSVGQATKWAVYWLPSALVGAICMGFVIAKFGLGSMQSRAVAGTMMFPFDYIVKRFIVFAKHVRLDNFIFKQKITLVVIGVLVRRQIGLGLRMTETA